MNISIAVLLKKIVQIFLEKGFNEVDTERTVDYLLGAEMSGSKTQRLVKMTCTEPLQVMRKLLKHSH